MTKDGDMAELMHPVKVLRSRADEEYNAALQHKRQVIERIYGRMRGMCPGAAQPLKGSESSGASFFVVSLIMLADFSLEQHPLNAEDSITLQRVENELMNEEAL
jgi:hypothetical protein